MNAVFPVCHQMGRIAFPFKGAPMLLKGIAASAGICCGKIYIAADVMPEYARMSALFPEEEYARLTDAADVFETETLAMAQSLEQQAGEQEARIVRAQIAIAKDPELLAQIRDRIDDGRTAEAALFESCERFMRILNESGNERMMQRASDIGDVKNRLLRILLGVRPADLTQIAEPSILVTDDLTPSMMVSLKAPVIGIITQAGGYTSHCAILARQAQIPAVLGVCDAVQKLAGADMAYIDGAEGVIETDPDAEAAVRWMAKRDAWEKKQKLLSEYIEKETMDADGNAYRVFANISNYGDVHMAFSRGAEGIGLFRTEILYIDRTQAPDEEAQYAAYLHASEVMRGKDVTIRTLDAGGDKIVSWLQLKREDNPFLGSRGIRFCLQQQELFAIQLRAILRASAAYHNIRILLPFISTIEELRTVRRMMEQIMEEMDRRKLPFDPSIPLGVMIETPSSVAIAKLLAKEADFFSIGTNDLTQYMMAADRGNASVAEFCSVLHPAVLRAIWAAVQAADEEKIPVSVCGEAASDPVLIPVLMGLGIRIFSVGSGMIPRVRERIAHFHTEETKITAGRMLEAATKEEVCAIIQQAQADNPEWSFVL